MIVGVALLALCGCATPLRTHGIPNYSLVATNLARGGEPNKEGWEYLQSQGFKIVIKLNTDAEGSDDYARQCGMTVDKYPITFLQQIFGPPYRTQIAVWEAAECGEKVFVHCSHGEDRTGLIVAMYRHQVQGWTKDAARKEMLALGFHPAELGLDWYYREKVP